MNHHLHQVANYIQLHRSDSEGKLRLLERQLLSGSPEYDAVVELLSELESAKEQAKSQREESRFLAQFHESRRHGWWTRLFAGFAVALSAGSLVVAILALNKRSQQPLPTAPILSAVPAASLPQTTNAACISASHK